MESRLLAWADGLAPARLAGGTLGDPPCRLTLAEGYGLADRAAPALGTPAGWKVGATSAGAMAFLGIEAPIRGRLFAERIWRDGDRADLSGDRPAEAEPEIAIRLDEGLAPAVDPRTVAWQAFAAAEIVRPSHPRPFDLGAGFIVADNAAGLGALIGPAIPCEALDDPAGLALTLTTSGGARTRGTADAVLGNPLDALAWLARTVGGLPAGTLVLTGAMARSIPLAPGDRLGLDAGAWGTAGLDC